MFLPFFDGTRELTQHIERYLMCQLVEVKMVTSAITLPLDGENSACFQDVFGCEVV